MAASTLVVDNCTGSPLIVGSLPYEVAMADGEPGSTVTFANGLSCTDAGSASGSTGPIALTQTLDITADMGIEGTGATIAVSGQGVIEVFAISKGVTATISGLTIENGASQGVAGPSLGDGGGGVGNAGTVVLAHDVLSNNTAPRGFGGAVFNLSGSATLTDDTLSGDSAAAGGGVENVAGTVSLTDDTLSNDSAGLGGGVDNDISGTATLIGDTLSNDSATEGGAVANDPGTVTLTDDTLSHDTATDQGGGIFNAFGTASLTDDTLSNDSALGNATDEEPASGGGGGIWDYYVNFSGDGANTLTLTDDTLTDDSAPNSFGGGVFDVAGGAILTYDTLSNDSAGLGGGGVAAYGGTAILTASILNGASCDAELEAEPYNLGHITDGGANVASDPSCAQTTSGPDPSLVATPAAIDLATSLSPNGSSGPQTLAIGPKSAAFEEVPSAMCATLASSTPDSGSGVRTDERGEPRPGEPGAGCDAGAFEFQAIPTTLSADPAILQLAGLRFHLFDLSATLTSSLGPVAGVPIVFSAGSSTLCTATTDAQGTATCNAKASAFTIVRALGYRASFVGNEYYLGSQAAGSLVG